MRNLIVDAKSTWDGIEFSMSDVAVFSQLAIVRKVETKGEGLVRFIFYNDFKLNGNEIGDTAFYDPGLDAVIHYKGKTWFLMGSTAPLYEYTMGRRDKEEVLKDCEDGTLSKNSIAQGSVASAVSIASPSFYYFIIAGESYDEVTRTFKELKENAQFNYEKNDRYWKSITSPLEDELARTSLAISLGHVGDKGEIPASLDTDILKFNLDTYAYICLETHPLQQTFLTWQGSRPSRGSSTISSSLSSSRRATSFRSTTLTERGGARGTLGP